MYKTKNLHFSCIYSSIKKEIKSSKRSNYGKRLRVNYEELTCILEPIFLFNKKKKTLAVKVKVNKYLLE